MSTIIQTIIATVMSGVAGVVLGLAAWRRLRTQQLRAEFGPEYDRAVERHGSRAKAERELLARRRRRRKLGVRSLSPEARDRYHDDWLRIEDAFAQDPHTAVNRADDLVSAVMGERGYPADDFDERMAVLCLEYGATPDHYLRAHEVRILAGHRQATIEDLRRSMADYRALLEDLLPGRPARERTRPALGNPLIHS
ncbi:MAG TPA: hypothetical protein VGP70_24660 [Actinomadura sp.]|nr:hypothetical protein [Actinomadura sp.]